MNLDFISQTFDAENRLISVKVGSQTTTFVHDGNGKLLKKINPDNTRTVYVAGIYEINKNFGGTVTPSCLPQIRKVEQE